MHILERISSCRQINLFIWICLVPFLNHLSIERRVLVANQSSAQEEALPAAAPPRQLEPAPGQSVYIVQQGETLYGICFELYQNLSKVDEICRINGLEDVNMLEAGRRLIVP